MSPRAAALSLIDQLLGQQAYRTVFARICGRVAAGGVEEAQRHSILRGMDHGGIVEGARLTLVADIQLALKGLDRTKGSR